MAFVLFADRDVMEKCNNYAEVEIIPFPLDISEEFRQLTTCQTLRLWRQPISSSAEDSLEKAQSFRDHPMKLFTLT